MDMVFSATIPLESKSIILDLLDFILVSFNLSFEINFAEILTKLSGMKPVSAKNKKNLVIICINFFTN